VLPGKRLPRRRDRPTRRRSPNPSGSYRAGPGGNPRAGSRELRRHDGRQTSPPQRHRECAEHHGAGDHGASGDRFASGAPVPATIGRGQVPRRVAPVEIARCPIAIPPQGGTADGQRRGTRREPRRRAGPRRRRKRRRDAGSSHRCFRSRERCSRSGCSVFARRCVCRHQKMCCGIGRGARDCCLRVRRGRRRARTRRGAGRRRRRGDEFGGRLLGCGVARRCRVGLGRLRKRRREPLHRHTPSRWSRLLVLLGG